MTKPDARAVLRSGLMLERLAGVLRDAAGCSAPADRSLRYVGLTGRSGRSTSRCRGRCCGTSSSPRTCRSTEDLLLLVPFGHADVVPIVSRLGRARVRALGCIAPQWLNGALLALVAPVRGAEWASVVPIVAVRLEAPGRGPSSRATAVRTATSEDARRDQSGRGVEGKPVRPVQRLRALR
jgi:hypothetical protein